VRFACACGCQCMARAAAPAAFAKRGYASCTWGWSLLCCGGRPGNSGGKPRLRSSSLARRHHADEIFEACSSRRAGYGSQRSAGSACVDQSGLKMFAAAKKARGRRCAQDVYRGGGGGVAPNRAREVWQMTRLNVRPKNDTSGWGERERVMRAEERERSGGTRGRWCDVGNVMANAVVGRCPTQREGVPPGG
jgi:hypothetical protein